MSDQPEQFPEQRARPVHPLERREPPPSSPPPAQSPQPQPQRLRVDFPGKQPVLTYLLLGINIVVFLVDQLMGGQLTALGDTNHAAILAGQTWRFVTPMFLHGNLLHIGFNAYFLYLVGPGIERMFGKLRFGAIYFLSGIAGAVASFALTNAPSIGASGALFGIIGAWIPVLYRNQKLLANTKKQIQRIVEVIAINLLIGLMPGIDNWAHLGGLAAGLALGWVASPRYTVTFANATSVKVEDTSEPGIVWLLVVVIGFVIAGIAAVLIWLKH
jgi:rhomboid protease GluP